MSRKTVKQKPENVYGVYSDNGVLLYVRPTLDAAKSMAIGVLNHRIIPVRVTPIKKKGRK